MSATEESVQQAQPTRLPKRWPLVAGIQNRTAGVPASTDARLVNAYAEYDSTDREYWVYKRVGLSPTALYNGIGNAQNMYTHPPTGNLYRVTNAELYFNNTGIQNTGDSFNLFDFDTVDSNPQTVVAQSAAGVWVVNTATRAVTVPATPNTAPLVQGLAYLDGTTYIMDILGNIWGSAIDDATTWNALNVVKASSNADAGVALAKQLSYVIAFKQYTTQIFFDNGNPPPGSPLSPVPDAQVPLGCLDAGTVQEIDASILWVSANKTAQPQVVQMDNITPQVVSTPAVERILRNFVSFRLSNPFVGQFFASSWVLKISGHRFYGLNIPGIGFGNVGVQGVTLVYDLDQKLWYYWTDSVGNWWPVVSIAYVPTVRTTLAPSIGQYIAQTQYLSGSSIVSNVYGLDTHDIYSNDYGNLTPVDIYTPNMDFGTNRRKTLKTMYVNGDKVSSTLSVRYTDDDYKTFSNPRLVDLGLKKPRLTNCGTFHRRRAYHYRHFANTPLRLKTIDLQMDIGTL